MSDDRVNLDKAIEYIVVGTDCFGNSYPTMRGFVEGFNWLERVANAYKTANPKICHMCIDMALPMNATNSVR